MVEQTQAITALTARVELLEQVIAKAFGGRPMRVGTAAEWLGVHRSTVHGWIRSGACPATKWQDRWEIPSDWVLATLVTRI